MKALAAPLGLGLARADTCKLSLSVVAPAKKQLVTLHGCAVLPAAAAAAAALHVHSRFFPGTHSPVDVMQK